jgi:hypothetical protein
MDHVVLISGRQMHTEGRAEANEGEQASRPSAVKTDEQGQTAK